MLAEVDRRFLINARCLIPSLPRRPYQGEKQVISLARRSYQGEMHVISLPRRSYQGEMQVIISQVNVHGSTVFWQIPGWKVGIFNNALFWFINLFILAVGTLISASVVCILFPITTFFITNVVVWAVNVYAVWYVDCKDWDHCFKQGWHLIDYFSKFCVWCLYALLYICVETNFVDLEEFCGFMVK